MKTTTVTLWLRVENANKFVRGKKRAREGVEGFHLRRYGMKKRGGWEYGLTFSCQDDVDLDRQVHDLLRDIGNAADFRHCFTEADVTENGTDRSW
ncbi:MAG: resolvase-like protein [Verrucomicrobia bacterium]|nr:resolvase-like protein [Verrucomicrobiota bacterium]